MGVNDKDTNAEISTAAPSTTPNSLNSLPTNPSKKMTGKNTAANVIDMDITAKNIFVYQLCKNPSYFYNDICYYIIFILSKKSKGRP